MQRPQVEEQLVIGAPVHRGAHRAAALRPRLPILVCQLLPAPVAGPGHGATDLTPHAERHECKRVAHDEDRKSTRLNSSHSQISYAVFCLKKKKTIRMY